jgi:hypothetical protein
MNWGRFYYFLLIKLVVSTSYWPRGYYYVYCVGGDYGVIVYYFFTFFGYYEVSFLCKGMFLVCEAYI